MTDPTVMANLTPFADDMIVVAHAGAKPGDLHLLSLVRAMDDGIIGYLKRREAAKASRKAASANHERNHRP
jgi:hypothetical protein